MPRFTPIDSAASKSSVDRPWRNILYLRHPTILVRPPCVAGDEIVIKGRQIEVNGRKLEHDRVPTESVDQIRNQVEGEVYYESHAGRRYQVQFTGDPLDESTVDEIKVTVPDHSVFVLGDNRDRSRDSRHIGSIHVSDVIGDVDYIFFPAETWSRFGSLLD